MLRRSPGSSVAAPLLAIGAVCVLAAGGAARGQGADPAPSIRWQHAVSPASTVEIDVPFGWEVIEPIDPADATRFAPLDGTFCDVQVEFAQAASSQPPIAGSEALRALVDGEARDFLDQAVESRYALRELRGPEAAGWYFMLRDRAPRKKGAVFLNRGALLVKDAVLRFSIATPKPDLPAIRQALKMLAGTRVVTIAPVPATDAASAPAGSTSAARQSDTP